VSASSLADMARNLERWVSLIVLRTYAHETITGDGGILEGAGINALSDLEHPCQALADFMTIEERFGTARGVKFVYVRRRNNVCHSLMLTAALLGAHCTVASAQRVSPPSRRSPPRYLRLPRNPGLRSRSPHDVVGAARGADAVYTDVCTAWDSSMR